MASVEDTHTTQAQHVLSDGKVRQYLRKYYYIANEPSLDKEYGDLFTEDGVFIMGSRKATGREAQGKSNTDQPSSSAIRSLRKKIWEEVPNRDHDAVKMFSHGNHEDDTELMVLGTATWGYHEGHKNVGDWAAHIKLEMGKDDQLRCSFYQIIM
ncbi:MAG: hypothetical protein Q9183_007702, partial [Haloplaca sp. 2 TL-2023]